MYFIIVLLCALFLFKVYAKFKTGRDKSSTCLIGKTAIITGANSGIGLETALDFAKRGARVILACRNENEAQKAKNKIIKESDNKNIVVKYIDFNHLKTVENFAADILETEAKIDILVNNAGAYGFGEALAEHGFNKVMQINHFACFLLTTLLLDKLKQSAPSRIVNVGSIAGSYVNLDVNKLNDYPSAIKLFAEYALYGKSKLCNMLFTVALAEKLKGTNVTCNCAHPGVVQTELVRNVPKILAITYDLITGYLLKTAEEGAQTTIYLAVSKEVENISGGYFADCQQKSYFGNVNKKLADELWRKTKQLLTDAGYRIN